MVTSRQIHRHRGGIAKTRGKRVIRDRIAIDVERESIVRTGTEGVVTKRGDLEEAGVGGSRVGRGAGDDLRPIAEETIAQAAGQEVRPRVADAGDLLGDDCGRSHGQVGERTIQPSTGVAEAGHVGPGEDSILQAERIGAAEDDRITRRSADRGQLGGGADGEEVREQEAALTDVDGLVPRVTEDDYRGAQCGINLRHGPAGGVSADIEQSQDIAVGARNVQGLPTAQGQV